jgi:hypothetical protein
VSFHFSDSSWARSRPDALVAGVGVGEPIVGRACGSADAQPPSTISAAHSVIAARVVLSLPMGQR